MRPTTVIGAVGAILMSMQVLAAQELRELHIETFIYTDRSSVPVSENLTLFADGKVYDFRMDTKTHDPLEVAIYDPSRKKFDLFDLKKEKRMSIGEEEIIKLLAKISADPNLRKRDELLFDADKPGMLVEDYDTSSRWLSLTSTDKRLEYRVKGTQPRNPDLYSAYCDYIDWYTRLNGTDPGKMPPFARLALNQAMRKYSIMPEQVELTYSPPGLLDRKIKATSKHYVNWDLTLKDRERIENVRQWIKFDYVQFAEYVKQTEIR